MAQPPPPKAATTAPDPDLLARAQSGDPGAVEALLKAYEGKIWRFGLAMCRDPHDAEDVMQESLLAAARGLGDFRGDASLSTWLFTIVRSFCRKRRRRSVGAPPGFAPIDADGPGLPDPGLDPEDVAGSRELHRALQDAIASLESKYREVLLLRDVEGLSAAEVAAVVGIGEAAVKSRLHRARAAVRAELSARLGEGPLAKPRRGCPDILLRFSQHLENDIDPQICAQMEQHLGSCERCRGACESLRRVLALCENSPAQSVPAPIQASVKAALRDVLAPRGAR